MFPIGQYSRQQLVEGGAVVEFLEVAQLVQDHEVDKRLRNLDQAEIEVDRAGGGAASPASCHGLDVQLGIAEAEMLDMRETGGEAFRENCVSAT